MRKALSRLIVPVLAFLCVSPWACGEISGQRVDTFQSYYEENVAFINDNTGRHLLPLAVASRRSDERDGRMYYEIFGDVLSLSLLTDPTGQVIETCQIILTAPPGMTSGNAVYNDFAISGYHSYALLMAMDAQPDPYDRYAMVTMVEDGLRQAEGAYSAQAGIYALTCTSNNGVVTITFDNTLASAGQEPEPQGEPEPEGNDEGAGMG